MAATIMRRLLVQPLRMNNRMAVSALGGVMRMFTNQAAEWTDEQLSEVVRENKVVVFMKGTPDAPMCGFSRAVVQILDMHGLQNYKTFDVLSNDDLRRNIKEFSKWPTVPQVYINGEFVGGCDIMIQLHREGDLIDELMKVGHRSALLDEDEQ